MIGCLLLEYVLTTKCSKIKNIFLFVSIEMGMDLVLVKKWLDEIQIFVLATSCC